MLIARYLAMRVFAPVWGVFGLALSVVAIFYLAQVLNMAASDGWPLELVLGTAALRLLLYLDVLLPAALLIGMVIGLGRVQQSNELTALTGAGVGRVRLMGMLTGWVLVLTVVVGFFSIWVRPWGYGQIYQIEATLAQRLDIAKVEPGRFQVGDDTWLIYARDREGTILKDVFVHQRRMGGRGVLTASELTQSVDENGLIRLTFNGDVASTVSSEGASAHGLVGRFDQLKVLVEPHPVAVRQKIRRAESILTLWDSDNPIELAELQWRIVAPLSVLVLAWVALALVSNQPRVQRNLFVLFSLVLVAVYFSALGVLVNWVEQGRLPAWPGVFSAPLGIVLSLCLLVVGGFVFEQQRRR